MCLCVRTCVRGYVRMCMCVGLCLCLCVVTPPSIHPGHQSSTLRVLLYAGAHQSRVGWLVTSTKKGGKVRPTQTEIFFFFFPSFLHFFFFLQRCWLAFAFKFYREKKEDTSLISRGCR